MTVVTKRQAVFQIPALVRVVLVRPYVMGVQFNAIHAAMAAGGIVPADNPLRPSPLRASPTPAFAATPVRIIGTEVAQTAFVGARFGAELLLLERRVGLPALVAEPLAALLAGLGSLTAGPTRMVLTRPVNLPPLSTTCVGAELEGLGSSRDDVPFNATLDALDCNWQCRLLKAAFYNTKLIRGPKI